MIDNPYTIIGLTGHLTVSRNKRNQPTLRLMNSDSKHQIIPIKILMHMRGQHPYNFLIKFLMILIFPINP